MAYCLWLLMFAYRETSLLYRLKFEIQCFQAILKIDQLGRPLRKVTVRHNTKCSHFGQFDS
jgi:hypothetical protein